MGAVVDAHGAALGSTLLVEVDTHAVAAPGDQGGVHAVAAQRVNGRLADGVGGQLGDVGNVHPVVGQGHGHVGLAAAEGELYMVALNKALVVVGLKTEHQLAESYDLCHFSFLPNYLFPTRCTAKPQISSAR